LALALKGSIANAGREKVHYDEVLMAKDLVEE
jgi:hypothetical protein